MGVPGSFPDLDHRLYCALSYLIVFFPSATIHQYLQDFDLSAELGEFTPAWPRFDTSSRRAFQSWGLFSRFSSKLTIIW